MLIAAYMEYNTDMQIDPGACAGDGILHRALKLQFVGGLFVGLALGSFRALCRCYFFVMVLPHLTAAPQRPYDARCRMVKYAIGYIAYATYS